MLMKESTCIPQL